MSSKYSNPCYRCGRERIIAKTWKEEIGMSEVIVTQTVCPDPECQKTVAKELKAQKKKAELMARKREERLLSRKRGKKTFH